MSANPLHHPAFPEAVFSPESLIIFEKDGDWCWCLHCERAYPRGWLRWRDDFMMCPYSGCDGDAVVDAWEWRQFQSQLPVYPEIPAVGVIYALNP